MMASLTTISITNIIPYYHNHHHQHHHHHHHRLHLNLRQDVTGHNILKELRLRKLPPGHQVKNLIYKKSEDCDGAQGDLLKVPVYVCPCELLHLLLPNLVQNLQKDSCLDISIFV